MKAYQEMNRGELTAERAALQQEFDGYKAKGLKLNMARGKPGADQLALSMPMLDVLNSGSDCKDEGIDCRNYGELTGIPSAKKLFGEVMGGFCRRDHHRGFVLADHDVRLHVPRHAQGSPRLREALG